MIARLMVEFLGWTMVIICVFVLWVCEVEGGREGLDLSELDAVGSYSQRGQEHSAAALCSASRDTALLIAIFCTQACQKGFGIFR